MDFPTLFRHEAGTVSFDAGETIVEPGEPAVRIDEGQGGNPAWRPECRLKP
jgi:hypothetical protein